MGFSAIEGPSSKIIGAEKEAPYTAIAAAAMTAQYPNLSQSSPGSRTSPLTTAPSGVLSAADFESRSQCPSVPCYESSYPIMSRVFKLCAEIAGSKNTQMACPKWPHP